MYVPTNRKVATYIPANLSTVTKNSITKALTDPLPILLPLVSVKHEVKATSRRDLVVVDLGVGNEVPHADPFASTVVELHVTNNATLHGRWVSVTVVRPDFAVLAVSCFVFGGRGLLKTQEMDISVRSVPE